MNGLPQPDDQSVLTKQTAGVPRSADAMVHHPGPCIRCGWCVEDCPVQINPALLADLAEAGQPGGGGGGGRERGSKLSRTPGATELTIFCSSMTGASLGFLWYNAHPAEVFMGDVGSLALGGGLGVVAVLLKQEILLLFIGGVFVVECLSVILQVGSYKLRGGKRIFKMAPLHHHFEQLGWAESKVIARFWIAGLVMALFALTTLKLR